MVFWSKIFMIFSENLGENDIFEPWYLGKNVSFFQFFASVIFFRIIVGTDEKWENLNFEKSTLVTNAKLLHKFRASENSNWVQKIFFYSEKNSQLKKCWLASGGNLPGIFPPKIYFDNSILIEIRNPKDWCIKIQNL